MIIIFQPHMTHAATSEGYTEICECIIENSNKEHVLSTLNYLIDHRFYNAMKHRKLVSQSSIWMHWKTCKKVERYRRALVECWSKLLWCLSYRLTWTHKAQMTLILVFGTHVLEWRRLEVYIGVLGWLLGVSKSYTTRELDKTNPFISKSWVEGKWVGNIFGSTRMIHLINESFLCLTYKLVWSF